MPVVVSLIRRPVDVLMFKFAVWRRVGGMIVAGCCLLSGRVFVFVTVLIVRFAVTVTGTGVIVVI